MGSGVDPAYTDRCRRHFELMAEGGADGKDVPTTPEELAAYQDADFLTIRLHFKAADIVVDYLPGKDDPETRL